MLLDDSNRGSEKQVITLWSAEIHGGRRYEVIHELDRATVLCSVPVEGTCTGLTGPGEGRFRRIRAWSTSDGRYLMYVSVPPKRGDNRWGQAVAASDDLSTWKTIGEIEPHGEAEANGLCRWRGHRTRRPSSLVLPAIRPRGPDDAICHATSTTA